MVTLPWALAPWFAGELAPSHWHHTSHHPLTCTSAWPHSVIAAGSGAGALMPTPGARRHGHRHLQGMAWHGTLMDAATLGCASPDKTDRPDHSQATHHRLYPSSPCRHSVTAVLFTPVPLGQLYLASPNVFTPSSAAFTVSFRCSQTIHAFARPASIYTTITTVTGPLSSTQSHQRCLSSVPIQLN